MPNDPPNSWQDEPDPWDDPGESASAWEDDDADDPADGGAQARNTAYCPECGAEIYDAADICPACYSWIDGDTTRRPPRKHRFRKGGAQLVVWLLVAALLAGAGLIWLVRVLGAIAGGG